jgi:hypothetical protein
MKSWLDWSTGILQSGLEDSLDAVTLAARSAIKFGQVSAVETHNIH